MLDDSFINQEKELIYYDGSTTYVLPTSAIVPYETKREGYVVIKDNKYIGYLKFATNVHRKGSKRSIQFKSPNATQYGEIIAKKIADFVGINACNADCGFIIEPYNRDSEQTVQIPVAISYFDFRPRENLVTAQTIIDWYRYNYEQKARELISNKNISDFEWQEGLVNCNIPLTIEAFRQYLSEKNLPEENIQDIIQHIIDMIMFDCKFGNTDRHDENYGLGIMNDGTGGVRFYPLFDNEKILGFSCPDYVIKEYSQKRSPYEKTFPHTLYSLLNFGCNFHVRRNIRRVVRGLFSFCPKEAAKAYEKVKKLSVEDLEEILAEYDELCQEPRHTYTLAVFNYLDREISTIYESVIGKAKDHSSSSIGTGTEEEYR